MTILVLLTIQAVPFGVLMVRTSAEEVELSTLNVGMLQAIDSLNPFIAYEDSSYAVFNLIYDRLITYDLDLKPTGLVAKSWEVDRWPDADNPATPGVDEGKDKLWRFTIVQGAKWHDGEPLTADDVEYSISINLAQEMWAFTPYINANMADHATAVNDTTVEVYLKLPNVHPETLVIPIVPKHIWGQYTPGDIQYHVENANPIGSGPFKFVKYEVDQYVILDRNPDYHFGPVAYDRLVFNFYKTDQVMAQDLQAGNIDVARFPALTFDSLKGKSNIETGMAKRYWQSTLGFNNLAPLDGGEGNPLLLDKTIRQAMHLAINKTYILDQVWGGYGEIGYALPAPVVPYYHWEPAPGEDLNYNVARANAMLDAAGYDRKDTDGIRFMNASNNPYFIPNPETVKLDFKFQVRNDNPEDSAAAPYLKDMWKAIGVNVRIEPTDESALETDVYTYKRHEVYMWYWSGDYDPTYILGVMTRDQWGGWNDPWWSNATYDSLYLEQMTLNGTERQQAVFKMQKIFYEESGMICMSYPYGLYAWNTLHFENWGDPWAHPGLTIDQFFGANPLFMQLVPTGVGGGGISTTTLMILGGVAAAVAVAVIVLLLMMKKRRITLGEGGPEKEEKKTGLE